MRYAAGVYVAVSFAVAWLCWGMCWPMAAGPLGAADMTEWLIAGSFGPFIGAGVCVARERGVVGMLRFYASGFDPRMGLFVFVVAFFLVPVLAVAAAFIYARQMGAPLALQMGWGDVPMAYLWLFVLGGPLGEEFGWSYLSDRLDERAPVIGATVALGIIWAVWHLPLFFLVVPGLLQHYMPFYVFLLFSVGLRFLFSWAYHSSGRKMLSNLVMHNALNFALSLVAIVAPVAGDAQLRLLYLTVFSYVAAAVLWLAAPPARRVVASI